MEGDFFTSGAVSWGKETSGKAALEGDFFTSGAVSSGKAALEGDFFTSGAVSSGKAALGEGGVLSFSGTEGASSDEEMAGRISTSFLLAAFFGGSSVSPISCFTVSVFPRLEAFCFLEVSFLGTFAFFPVNTGCLSSWDKRLLPVFFFVSLFSEDFPISLMGTASFLNVSVSRKKDL